MKAVFVIDVDEDELGEAVATITAEENDITFFARGVIRPLPCKKYMRQMPSDVLEKDKRKRDFIIHKVDVDNSYVEGWNDCLDAITGETE